MSADKWFLDEAKLGNMYHSCSAGAVTCSTVSKTCTGLVISNPFGSGKLVVMQSASFQPSNAPAGVSIVGLAISTAVSQTQNTHTTPAVIHNALATGGNVNVGVAKVDAAATLIATPLWLRAIGGVAAASSISPAKYKEDFDGTLILSPGMDLSFSYLTTAALGIASFSWVEIDE